MDISKPIGTEPAGDEMKSEKGKKSKEIVFDLNAKNGKIPWNNANTASTAITSCVIAKIAPVEYCHFPKRIKI